MVYQLEGGIRELHPPGQSKEIIGTVERLDPRFDMLIPKDAQLEKIADGYIWTEGAVWYKPARCLLFSDIPNNVVIKWEPGKGTSEYLKPSGYTGPKPRGGKAGDEPGSNGLFVDSQGRLHLCEHGDRRLRFPNGVQPANEWRQSTGAYSLNQDCTGKAQVNFSDALSSAWWNWRIQVATGTEDVAGYFRAVSEAGRPSDVFSSHSSRIARIRALMNENTAPSLL